MRKLGKIGFVDIQRGEELPYGVEECALYPIFTPELLELMRSHIPRERWARVAHAVTFVAQKARPEAPTRRTEPAGANLVEGPVGTRVGTVADVPRPDAMWDFGSAGCEEGVLLKIRNLLVDLAPGQVLEIRSADPGVREDLPAWCRMTGQGYEGAFGSHYFVRKR